MIDYLIGVSQVTIWELGFWAPMHCGSSRGTILGFCFFSIWLIIVFFSFRTSPSLSFLLPSSRLWSPDEILVQTSSRNYTINDFKDFFEWDMTKKNLHYRNFQTSFLGFDINAFEAKIIKATISSVMPIKGFFCSAIMFRINFTWFGLYMLPYLVLHIQNV